MVDWVNIIHSWLIWFRVYWLCILFRENLEHISHLLSLSCFLWWCITTFQFPLCSSLLCNFQIFLKVFLCSITPFLQIWWTHKMLQSIMCIFEQTIGDALTETFILRKDLIKHNKANGIMRMETHMECTHLKLFT
jgi:hypothetical protein